MNQELASLKNQRSSNKGRLTTILNFLENANESTPIEEFRTRLTRAEKLMSEFTAIETKIFDVDPREDSDMQYEESYYKAITSINTFIRSKSTSSGTFANLDASICLNHSGTGHAEIKLPKINIPPFNGDYTEWQSFYDLYCSTIHESVSLNPVQKFQYLKGLLRGEPAVLLRHISITEANYLGALNKLKERYNRKRPIIYSFIRTFIEQPTIHTANASNIKRLMDTSDEVVRGLKALGEHAETRDPWLIYLSLNKLDDKSKLQWAEQEELTHWNPSARARTTQRCFNCLSTKHPVFKCTSQRRCQQCQRKHHSLLHTNEETEISSEKTTPENPTTALVVFACSQNTSVHAILPTAIINIVDSSGKTSMCRALLDSGSQVSFITEACSQRLNLKRKNARVSVCGLGQTKAGFTRGAVNFVVKPEKGAAFTIEALVLSKITTKIPAQNLDLINLARCQEIKLADPNFAKSSNIDVLIGANYFFKILKAGQIKLKKGQPMLQNRIFGWVVSGRIGSLLNPTVVSMITSTDARTVIDIDQILRRFWEIESITTSNKLLSPEEQLCEDKFAETLQKSSDGRFIVKLPFKKSPQVLGQSMNSAISRLQGMERRFGRDPEFFKLYQTFMHEYHTLKHMEEIPQEEIDHSRFYLPHHGVLRQSSTTTKLKVVFNGSAKSSSGVSLNDCLAIGPTIQSTLYAIILRFREHHIVFSADIEKMYRQVRLSKDDTNYQKIVWRTTPADPIRHYRLQTVTYGLASAPFLATRLLRQVADENQHTSPRAANAIRNDIYVDDLMTGADDIKEALALKENITHLLKNHGLNLRKWTSNAMEIRNTIDPDDLLSISKELDDSTDKTSNSVKVLGVTWNPSTDEFIFTADLQYNQKLTKITILSQASRLFDPLGWIAPVVILFKIFIQHLWAANLGWDDVLPDHRAKEWCTIYGEMENVNQITISRHLNTFQTSKIQMHGFCDASQQAYAAAVYFRIESTTGKVTCKLISAKTKVAPIKQATLPRLELCGAVLLTKLLNSVKRESRTQINQVYCWTDSKIVLDWLASHPRRWSTFVGNRVAEISNSWSRQHWRHVSSTDNPADCASRGLLPLQLKTHTLWWNGPDWLSQSPDYWPTQHTNYGHIEEESNQLFAFTSTISPTWFDEVVQRYSSFRRLRRVLAYMCRFISNLRKPKGTRTDGIFLRREELFNAIHHIYRQEQRKYYPNEIESLITKLSVGTNSTLKSLNPFIDESGIIRVGGRLTNSEVPFSIKHPIIIHAKSKVTSLLLEELHQDNKHAGASLLLSLSRQTVWIPAGRNRVRQVIKKCVICARFKSQMQTQLMGNLPQCRVELVRPFLKTGVDYAGPVLMHLVKGRGQKTYKVYVCLFICLSTKAVHLELVNDMTSEAFLASLKRFIARRGVCQEIYSDNGSDFIGANNQLREEFHKLIKQSNNISAFSSSLCITWHFNPPSAPHFGGIWEAGIKSTKFHLKRIVGKTILTMEELQTLLIEIEAILNSRPLCSLPSNDIDALTPSHFLIGHAATKISEFDITHLKMSYVSRLQMVQQLSQNFWKRWSIEYLTSLQQRTKWQRIQRSIKINDIVVIKENNVPANQWLLGRVIAMHPGSDGIVRVATLKTKSGDLKRPIHKLCLLPVAHDESSEEVDQQKS